MTGYDDAFYTSSFKSLANHLSSWCLSQGTWLVPDPANMPQEAWSGLCSFEDSAQFARLRTLYRDNSAFRAGLLQQYAASILTREVFGYRLGRRAFSQLAKEIMKSVPGSPGAEDLIDNVLAPALDLAEKIYFERRKLVILMANGTTMFDERCCTTSGLTDKPQFSPPQKIMFCFFPALVLKGSSTFILSKALVSLEKEWLTGSHANELASLALTTYPLTNFLDGIKSSSTEKERAEPLVQVNTHSGWPELVNSGPMSPQDYMNKNDLRPFERKYFLWKRFALILLIVIAMFAIGLVLLGALGTRKSKRIEDHGSVSIDDGLYVNHTSQPISTLLLGSLEIGMSFFNQTMANFTLTKALTFQNKSFTTYNLTLPQVFLLSGLSAAT